MHRARIGEAGACRRPDDVVDSDTLLLECGDRLPDGLVNSGRVVVGDRIAELDQPPDARVRGRVGRARAGKRPDDPRVVRLRDESRRSCAVVARRQELRPRDGTRCVRRLPGDDAEPR
jgi:hypothetical protein